MIFPWFSLNPLPEFYQIHGAGPNREFLSILFRPFYITTFPYILLKKLKSFTDKITKYQGLKQI